MVALFPLLLLISQNPGSWWMFFLLPIATSKPLSCLSFKSPVPVKLTASNPDTHFSLPMYPTDLRVLPSFTEDFDCLTQPLFRPLCSCHHSGDYTIHTNDLSVT